MKRLLTWIRSVFRMVMPGMLWGLILGSLIWEFLWLRLVEKASTLDILNFVVLLALVLVTLGYTVSTNRIAKATEASVAEFEKQRILRTQPWVFPQLAGVRGNHVPAKDLALENIGRGPALKVKAFIGTQTDPVTQRHVQTMQQKWRSHEWPMSNVKGDRDWPFVKADSTVTWPNAFENPPQGEHGVIFIEYSDIYGRTVFMTGWAYQVSGTGANAVLVAGEPLYPVVREELS